MDFSSQWPCNVKRVYYGAAKGTCFDHFCHLFKDIYDSLTCFHFLKLTCLTVFGFDTEVKATVCILKKNNIIMSILKIYFIKFSLQI